VTLQSFARVPEQTDSLVTEVTPEAAGRAGVPITPVKPFCCLFPHDLALSKTTWLIRAEEEQLKCHIRRSAGTSPKVSNHFRWSLLGNHGALVDISYMERKDKIMKLMN